LRNNLRRYSTIGISTRLSSNAVGLA
jgi:hypothetical protein